MIFMLGLGVKKDFGIESCNAKGFYGSINTLEDKIQNDGNK